MKLFSARKLQVDSAVTRLSLAFQRSRFTGQVMACAGINCCSTACQHILSRFIGKCMYISQTFLRTLPGLMKSGQVRICNRVCNRQVLF